MSNTPFENLPFELHPQIFSPFKEDIKALIEFSTLNHFFKELINLLFLSKIKNQKLMPIFFKVLKGHYEDESELIITLAEKLKNLDTESFLKDLFSFQTTKIVSAPKDLINLLGTADPFMQFLEKTNQNQLNSPQYWFEFTEKYLQMIQERPLILLHQTFLDFRSQISSSLLEPNFGLPLMLLLYSESRLENKRTLLEHIIHELKKREEIVRQTLLGIPSHLRIKNKLVDYYGGGKELYGTSRLMMIVSLCALATVMMVCIQSIYGAVNHEPLLIFPTIIYLFLEGILNQINKIIPNGVVMGFIAELAMGSLAPATAFFGYLFISFVDAFKTVRHQNTYSTKVLSDMGDIIELFESCFDSEKIIILDEGVIEEIKLLEEKDKNNKEIISNFKTNYQPEGNFSYQTYPGTLWKEIGKARKGVETNTEEEIKEKASNQCVFI